VGTGRWTFIANVIAYRLLSVWPSMPGAGARCRMVTRTGASITYRRDRGDLQGIREIFIDEIYRLPDGASPTSLIDLGANIGLATLWLCRTYHIDDALAVEPVSANIAILEANLRDNNLRAVVVPAAVGSADGVATFSDGASTNLGRIAATGVPVEVVGMDRLIARLRTAPSLLKMDIEGAEGDVILGTAPTWLASFDLVVTELHPEHVNIDDIIKVFAKQGFDYMAPIQFTQGTTRWKRERVFAKSALRLSR
jgi:FkbM family methyltransferase